MIYLETNKIFKNEKKKKKNLFICWVDTIRKICMEFNVPFCSVEQHQNYNYFEIIGWKNG